MKTRSINEIKGTEREVFFNEGISYRLILERDNMGFSVHKTIIPKGEKGHWHYRNHLESCYCIEGCGELTNLGTGEKYSITPDTIYILDENDNHTFEAFEDVVLISVFNPPVSGNEIHDDNGSYSLPSNRIEKNKLAAQTLMRMANSCNNNYDCVELIEKYLNKTF